MNPKIIAALAFVGAASLTAGGVAITLDVGRAIVAQVDESRPNPRNVKGLISLDLDRGEGSRAGKCTGSARYTGDDDKVRELLHVVPCTALDAFDARATRVRLWRELGDPHGDVSTDTCYADVGIPGSGTMSLSVGCAMLDDSLADAKAVRAMASEWPRSELPIPKDVAYEDREGK